MVEYRVLSSNMMKNTANLSFVWDQLEKAIEHCSKGSALPDSSTVRSVINDSKKDLATQIVAAYHIL